MNISNDEPDDTSLVPMNQLGVAAFTPNSVTLPTGETKAATRSHYLDDSEPRLMALHHLEMERAKNRRAEKEKTKLELREQRRIAMLKERELERQRLLNSSRENDNPPSIFVSKTGKSNTNGNDQILQRNVSFGTTNTTLSSMRSPSCVLSPCVVCNGAERTHIAQPCMHFYFCEECANSLQKSSDAVCPVCSAKTTSFSRVYT